MEGTMVTTVILETPMGMKTVGLADIVLFLFEQLPKDKREKFLREVPSFRFGDFDLGDMEGVS